MQGQATMTQSELSAALNCVVDSGDSIIVHSSLRSIGWVDGGAETVIAALLDVLGPAGNLMLPTFNYTRPLPEPWYDPETTPARTGIIPDTGRCRDDAKRSLHPTHSVAVIGPADNALTENHLATRAFGVGSPIDRLLALGGKVLLLGVGHVSNSALHVAEEHAGIPKVSGYDPLPDIKIRLTDGSIIEHALDSSPSCSAAFGAAEDELRNAGAVRNGQVGDAPVQVVDGRTLLTTITGLLADRPDALLCSSPDCVPCQGTRKALG